MCIIVCVYIALWWGIPWGQAEFLHIIDTGVQEVTYRYVHGKHVYIVTYCILGVLTYSAEFRALVIRSPPELLFTITATNYSYHIHRVMFNQMLYTTLSSHRYGLRLYSPYHTQSPVCMFGVPIPGRKDQGTGSNNMFHPHNADTVF